MFYIGSHTQAKALYDVTRKLFTIGAPLVGSITFFWDAPFGRFTRGNAGLFIVDGIKSWIIMELVSPFAFIYNYLHSPISKIAFNTSPRLSPTHPPTLLALLFLAHYLNRALISPLRTPSRSKSNLAIPFVGACFNIANGSLLGAYLSSPSAHGYLSGAFNSPRFWLGVTLWAIGFAGNIAHDEILLNIRRSRQAQTKANGALQNTKEHYAVPHGLLFRYVTFPNYFCEWVEWFGFALAAAPLPSIASPSLFLATIQPPWIFLLAEVGTMLPRAWRGHKWYHRKFEDYPQERKVVVPFVL